MVAYFYVKILQFMLKYIRGGSLKIPISFKNTPDEKKLLDFLESKSKIIGKSAYIKQLLYEQMMREKKDK